MSWFNGKKITEHKPRECRSFLFTDKEVRGYDYDMSAKSYSDSGCKNLRICVSENGNHVFMYQNVKTSKVIGSIYSVSVKLAREIVNNINDNLDEFVKERPNIKTNLVGYISRHGFYPHKKVEEVHAESYENVIKKLREDNEYLIEENKSLNEQIDSLKNRLSKIRVICMLEKQFNIVDEAKDD